MNNWAAAFAGLMVVVGLMHVAARLWPKRAGYRYLRLLLSRRGFDTTQIPPECVRAFVDDAYDYVCIVCAPASRTRRGVGRIAEFEFERVLRGQSFAIHAILTGKDVADYAKMENEVHMGTGLDRCRAILCRYDLSMPMSAMATAELNLPH